MAARVRFRTHPGSVVVWGLLHACAWSIVAAVIGWFGFTQLWVPAGVGFLVGAGHALFEWLITSTTVADGQIVSRYFAWVDRVEISEIAVVQRARRRRWTGVILQTHDGREVVLSAPVSSVSAPNPLFDEEVSLLCASIALDVNPDRWE